MADRLAALGLIEERFVRGKGPTYFATDAGDKANGGMNVRKQRNYFAT